jgi:hypothetical protein
VHGRLLTKHVRATIHSWKRFHCVPQLAAQLAQRLSSLLCTQSYLVDEGFLGLSLSPASVSCVDEVTPCVARSCNADSDAKEGTVWALLKRPPLPVRVLLPPSPRLLLSVDTVLCAPIGTFQVLLAVVAAAAAAVGAAAVRRAAMPLPLPETDPSTPLPDEDPFIHPTAHMDVVGGVVVAPPCCWLRALVAGNGLSSTFADAAAGAMPPRGVGGPRTNRWMSGYAARGA